MNGRIGLVAGVAVLLSAVCGAAGARVVYVDDDAAAGGDGRSWATAYSYLQDGLADANSSAKPVEVRVAQGVYQPDRSEATPGGSGDRKVSFGLFEGLSLIGGYAGIGAADPNEWDVEAYETILSGDLAGDDPEEIELHTMIYNRPWRKENSYHVLDVYRSATVLKGLTIMSGNASGTAATETGGAIKCRYSSIYIADCRFMYNSSVGDGGAIFAIMCDLTMVRCYFYGNSGYKGGAVYSFAENTIQGCVFRDNYSSTRGGALFGGGKINDCIFTDNTTFINSKKHGGAIYCGGVATQAENCVFIGNMSGNGGGISADGDVKLYINNCTFAGQSSESGRAVYAKPAPGYSAELICTNSIFRNGGNELEGFEYGPIECHVAYCNVQGGWPGKGNIDTDPQFADPDNDDYHLKSQGGRWASDVGQWVQDDVTSLCIDAGDPMSPVGYEVFPNGGRINMGAYGGTDKASKSWFGEPVCETIISGDINGDCRVDFVDLSILTSHWLWVGFEDGRCGVIAKERKESAL